MEEYEMLGGAIHPKMEHIHVFLEFRGYRYKCHVCVTTFTNIN